MNTQINRRRFLQNVATITIVPAAVLGRSQAAPSNRLTVGLIGCGGRGTGVMNSFLNEADTQVIGVCDPYESHFRDKTTGRAYGWKPAAEMVGRKYKTKPCDHYTDYREMVTRKDLDTVIIGTPDHWHAVQTLAALRHGKDVYCEKPVTHFFAEGQAVYREVAKRKAIFQTGSQQRSDHRFRLAVEIVRNGLIGDVKEVQVGLPGGTNKDQGDTTAHDYSKRKDFQLWTGPAPMLDYTFSRHHRNWRWHLAYGGGQLMDWIGHHNDICHWALGQDRGGPTRVEAKNFTSNEAKTYNAPPNYEVHCEYPNGIRTSMGPHNRMGLKVIGTGGWVYVTRGKIECSKPALLDPGFCPGPFKAYLSQNHTRNFLDCVKSRKETICPAETAHRSITPGHLGYVSNTLGRALKWDAQKETITGDAEAQKLLSHMTHRKPWLLG